MPIQDLRSIDSTTSLKADLCIVGSGPAGYAIARNLKDSGLDILLIESGGLDMNDETEALNAVEDVGTTITNARCRVLGGTTEAPHWGNRCISFDDIDYEERPWVPHSGWPIGHEAVAPYLEQASDYLGAGRQIAPRAKLAEGKDIASLPRLNEDKVRYIWWNFGRTEGRKPVRYNEVLKADSTGLNILIHATVSQIILTPSERAIESIEVSDAEGRRRTIRTRAVVLCAGGLENPRILLYSNKQKRNGIGNDHDQVGRYLMDHPRDKSMAVTFDPRQATTFWSLFGPFRYESGAGRRPFVRGFVLSPDYQRRYELLNCAAWPEEEMAHEDPLRAAVRLVRNRSSNRKADVGAILGNADYLARALHSTLVSRDPIRRKPEKIGLYVGSEQVPDPDSRVTLTDRLDRLGLPVPRTDWRINAREVESQIALSRHIAEECRRVHGLDARLADWVQDWKGNVDFLTDGCHPTATTKMSADPRSGVVDPDCQVHGVEGLYVAGSSTFPTAGHANPTLMIVALALRLAHHLRGKLAAA